MTAKFEVYSRNLMHIVDVLWELKALSAWNVLRISVVKQLAGNETLAKYSALLLLIFILGCTRSICERERCGEGGQLARDETARYTTMACGGGFPIFPPCAPSQYVTGQSKFVGNGGLVPEVKDSNSCSLKCNCLEGLTRCETSSSRYYWDEGLTFDSYCETFAAGEKPKVPELTKSTSNCTLSMLEAFKAKPAAAVSSAYIDPIRRSNHLHLHSSKGQRSSKGTDINPTVMESSHEFKPDDASSHNMLSKSSGDLEILSESINECLVQDARPREADNMQTAMKGLKRKAAELLKKPAGIEVQSERRSQEESRIVRVSRLTGGKDRHSKVRTAKGLRDRRVRLSVSTAIQFYDLQDRLGYEQPSLAVDWLLKAAQPFIAELPQSDKDVNSLSVSVSAPVVDAGSNLASANCSPVKRKENATATASAKSETKFSEKELTTIQPRKHSEAGKSNSSASDGSIMGAEYTSKSTSLSKSARLKEARERFKRKSTSAKIPSAFSDANSLESSLQSQFMNVLSYKDESSYGISNEISGDHGQHQLWDCGTQLAYTDILCKDSRQLQHMGHLGSSSTAALQQSIQPGMRSCYEIADSGMTYIDSNQRNSVQLYFNPMYTYLTQQQQSQPIQKHYTLPYVSAYSNDVSFTTSGFCTSRGPLQSNPASCFANYSPLHAPKNVYAEASARPNMLSLHSYDPRMSERFTSSLNENANNEATR